MGLYTRKKYVCKKLRVKAGGGCLLEGDTFALRGHIFRRFIHLKDKSLLTPGSYNSPTKLYKLNELETGV